MTLQQLKYVIEVRIVPRYDYFTIEIVFLVGEKVEPTVKKERCMGIDLGLNNVATVVSNTGLTPILFKGGKIKSINQWYNKMRSLYYAVLRKVKSVMKVPFTQEC